MIQFIAEIGLNHFGDISRALEMIDECADNGVKYIKFQYFNLEAFINPKLEYYELFKKSAIDFNFLKTTRDYCKRKGLKWGCSAFDIQSVNEMLSLEPDYLKVASCESLNRELHDILLPMKHLVTFVSIGMADLEEVYKLWADFPNLVIFHCVSEYPTKPEHVALDNITGIKEFIYTKCKPHARMPGFGYSSHAVGTDDLVIAHAKYGVNWFEKHLCLDGDRENAELNALTPDLACSLTAEEIAETIYRMKAIDKMMVSSTIKFDTRFLRENYSKRRGDE